MANESRVTAPNDETKMLANSILAYFIVQDQVGHVDPYWSHSGIVGEVNAFQLGESDIDAAFWTLADDGWITLSVRGTLLDASSFWELIATIEDWYEDDETYLEPLYPDPQSGKVHRGFRRAAFTLWPYLMRGGYFGGRFQAGLASVDYSKVKGIRVTGHSKGAALSQLLAAIIATELTGVNGSKPAAIEVYSFACPLLGDATFVSYFASQRAITKAVRFQRWSDIVPFVPPYDSFNIRDANAQYCTSLLSYALRPIFDQMYAGYHLCGDLVFYDGPDPATSVVETGPTAISHSQYVILAAIQGDHGDTIAGAHSAVKSYWPAVTRRNWPQPEIEDLRVEFEAILG